MVLTRWKPASPHLLGWMLPMSNCLSATGRAQGEHLDLDMSGQVKHWWSLVCTHTPSSPLAAVRLGSPFEPFTQATGDRGTMHMWIAGLKCTVLRGPREDSCYWKETTF